LLLLAKVDTLVEEAEADRHTEAELAVTEVVVTQTAQAEMLTLEAQAQDLMEDLEL
jgi:hypothetical protein